MYFEDVELQGQLHSEKLKEAEALVVLVAVVVKM